jgi:hypothetical protein
MLQGHISQNAPIAKLCIQFLIYLHYAQKNMLIDIPSLHFPLLLD